MFPVRIWCPMDVRRTVVRWQFRVGVETLGGPGLPRRVRRRHERAPNLPNRKLSLTPTRRGERSITPCSAAQRWEVWCLPPLVQATTWIPTHTSFELRSTTALLPVNRVRGASRRTTSRRSTTRMAMSSGPTPGACAPRLTWSPWPPITVSSGCTSSKSVDPAVGTICCARTS